MGLYVRRSDQWRASREGYLAACAAGASPRDFDFIPDPGERRPDDDLPAPAEQPAEQPAASEEPPSPRRRR